MPALARLSRIAALISVVASALIAGAPTAQAAFPGENGKIAFSAFRNGNMDIYTVNPDGTGLQQITSDPAWDSDPVWSADGLHIAFMRDIYIYTMDADGTGARLVYGPLDYATGRPTWSPDGTQLAFSDSYYDDIYTIGIDGQGRTRVITHYNPHTSNDPAWSPDGTKIAFAHYDSSAPISSEDIHVVNVDGAGEVNLTPTPTEYEMMPNWSPDGRFIAMGDDVSSVGVRVMNADGSNRAVVPGTQSDREPAFSPDGTKLVASTWIRTPTSGYSQLVAYDRNGSGRALIPGTEKAEDPDWQPLPAPVEPNRGDYKNASNYCKALSDFLGESEFGKRYRNHGTCVSANL
jgi:Tol biopolymer transport system component